MATQTVEVEEVDRGDGRHPNRNGHSGSTTDDGERREETDGRGSELFDE